MDKNQHIVKTDDGWGVRGVGNSQLTSTHRTQSATSNAARTITKHEKSEVVIHGRDGSFVVVKQVIDIAFLLSQKCGKLPV